MALLTRIILASTDKHDWILDPFAGSSTTGIAANLCGRRFLGIEHEKDFALLSQARRMDLNDTDIATSYIKKITDFSFVNEINNVNESDSIYGIDLPF